MSDHLMKQHLSDPVSPRTAVKLGLPPTPHWGSYPALAYCGASLVRETTQDFFRAVNYTGAGLMVRRGTREDTCPDCVLKFEAKQLQAKPE